MVAESPTLPASEEPDPREELRHRMLFVILQKLEHVDNIESLMWIALDEENEKEYRKYKREYRNGLKRYFQALITYIMEFGECPPPYYLYCAKKRLIPVKKSTTEQSPPQSEIPLDDNGSVS